jgi:diaminohydroxyphosphoribosylaminopyrimidine deaminase/5-amino-6-(5-phosphoribosylamino)uracil reductase
VKGHVPVRIVMSQTCDLPEEANLWNVHEAYTIVATQRGARRDFQKKLAMKGVEVVEFDMLNPRDVMSYCYDRGYLSVLWECGGTLSAAAISARVIHKVNAFYFTICLSCAITYVSNILIVIQNVYLLPLLFYFVC